MNVTLDWVTLAQIIRESIFLAVLLMGWKRVWVFGWAYMEVVRERNAWRKMALRGTGFMETLAELDSSGQRRHDDDAVD